MNWKKSIVFCVSFSILFFAETVIIACGPEQDPYDYYVSFFHNNVQGDDYKPFAFNGMLFLNSEEDIQDESVLNSSEWAKYLNVTQKDVHKVMYDLDSATTAKLKKSTFKWTNTLPDSLKGNSFLIALSKNQQALDYYRLVKACEPMIISGYNSWIQSDVDSLFLIKSANNSIKLIEKEKEGFLKLRYAYQAQRMFRYGGDAQKSKQVYEKYIANSTSASAVKGWAMAQYAGMIDDRAEAAYLFSKVFASNPERRIMAYRNYFWRESKITDVLRFAKNDNEKANIWAINGFKHPDSDIEHLKEAYNCDPNHPLISALLIREVNKLEQNLLEKSEFGLDYVESLQSHWQYYRLNQDSLKTANLKHLKIVKAFALKLADDKKYNQPSFAIITAAYLSWIENNEADAANYLAKVDVANLSPRLKDQFRITELLVKASQIKKGTAFNENELLVTLRWLDEKRYAENKTQPRDKWSEYGLYEGENRFTKTTRDFYQQILAPAYTKLGDTASAALAMLKGDLNYKIMRSNSFEDLMSYQTNIFWHQALSEKTLQKLADLRLKKSEGSFQDFLITGLNTLKRDDFYELQGTAYLRAHQYAKAIQCFNKLSKNFKFWQNNSYEWENNAQRITGAYYANPFIETIKDWPKKYLKKSNGINKKTFAQEMLRLQKLIVSDPKNASAYYYRLANAVYQTGEFGNAWYFISYDSKVFVHPEFNYNYNGDYKFANMAKYWYQKARNLSKDQNFKAKCTYMIAKCEQKKIMQEYDAIIWKDSEDYEKDRRDREVKFGQMMNSNPYYSELRQNYSKAPFYKIAIGDCSDFRDFLKANP